MNDQDFVAVDMMTAAQCWDYLYEEPIARTAANSVLNHALSGGIRIEKSGHVMTEEAALWYDTTYSTFSRELAIHLWAAGFAVCVVEYNAPYKGVPRVLPFHQYRLSVKYDQFTGRRLYLCYPVMSSFYDPKAAALCQEPMKHVSVLELHPPSGEGLIMSKANALRMRYAHLKILQHTESLACSVLAQPPIVIQANADRTRNLAQRDVRMVDDGLRAHRAIQGPRRGDELGVRMIPSATMYRDINYTMQRMLAANGLYTTKEPALAPNTLRLPEGYEAVNTHLPTPPARVSEAEESYRNAVREEFGLSTTERSGKATETSDKMAHEFKKGEEIYFKKTLLNHLRFMWGRIHGSLAGVTIDMPSIPDLEIMASLREQKVLKHKAYTKYLAATLSLPEEDFEPNSPKEETTAAPKKKKS